MMAQELYDLVGEDGRRIHRSVPRAYAESEKARINAVTAGLDEPFVEDLAVVPVPSEPPVGDPPRRGRKQPE